MLRARGLFRPAASLLPFSARQRSVGFVGLSWRTYRGCPGSSAQLLLEKAEHGPASSSRIGGRHLSAEEAFKNFVELLEKKFALPANVSGPETASAVLCTLNQRLSLGDARHVLEAAPSPLRELMRSCVLHRRETLGQVFDRQEFIRRVAEHLHIPDEQAEPVVRAVFAAIQHLPGELEIEGHLPTDLQELWESVAKLGSR